MTSDSLDAVATVLANRLRVAELWAARPTDDTALRARRIGRREAIRTQLRDVLSVACMPVEQGRWLFRLDEAGELQIRRADGPDRRWNRPRDKG